MVDALRVAGRAAAPKARRGVVVLGYPAPRTKLCIGRRFEAWGGFNKHPLDVLKSGAFPAPAPDEKFLRHRARVAKRKK